MFTNTLYPTTEQVLNRLKGQAFLKDYYLAGGTALALQLDHRRSIDLDFFTPNVIDTKALIANMADFKPTIIQEASGTLNTIIDEVKVSFMEYRYSLLEQSVKWEEISLAGILDIAGMKITAISSRGSKKDFIDLYFILKKYPLPQLFENFDRKYAGVNYEKAHLLKSLTYFNDAENDPEPDLLTSIKWEEVKKEITKQVNLLV